MFRLFILELIVFVIFVVSENREDHDIINNHFGSPFNTNTERLNKEQNKVVSYRLPNSTFPEKYEIHLRTNIHKAEFNYTGKIEISLKTRVSTKEIVIHQQQLTITGVILETITKPKFRIELDGEPTYDNVTQFLIIKSKRSLTSDTNYKLTINFNGKLRNDTFGFYRSSYNNSKGETIWLATTHFEPAGARSAFPCYDEPAMKAEFVYHITHDSNYTALTNFNEISKTNNHDGTVTSCFGWDGDGTIKMSTYLVAFVISDFKFIENKPTNGKIHHRIFSRPKYIEEGRAEFALDASEKILDKLAEVLNTPYTLNKMDQISVPDFAPGAMENWGLVIYRDMNLMYKENESAYSNKFRVATTISHELAHQWFGNLVTLKWWTYLWLNEGFATYFSSYATELVYPDWRAMDLLSINHLQSSLRSEAETSDVPLTYYVEDVNKSGWFRQSVYDKGGSVIRMMEHMMGSDKFFEGLKIYLTSRQMKEATEDHLFDALSSVAGTGDTFPKDFDLKEVMYSWTQQAGFPLVTVQRNYENNSITFHQERFFTTKPTEKDTTTYYIPYNLATVADAANPSTAPLGFIPKGMTEFLISPDDSYSWKSDEWIIVNNKQTGYYRVNYDEENWKMITEQLMSDPSKINIQNKAQLLDDAFNLAEAGDIDYDIPLNLAAYLTKETDYIPWIAAINGLNALNTRILGTSNYHLFQKYYASLIEPYFKQLGLEDKPTEPFIDKFGRTIAIRTACAMGVSECQSATFRYLANAFNYDKEVHPNIKGEIYCGALRNASNELFDSLYLKMINSNDSNEKANLINALGCSYNNNQLHNLLYSSLDRDKFTDDEFLSIVDSVLHQKHYGIKKTIDFLISGKIIEYRKGFKIDIETLLEKIAFQIQSDEYHEMFQGLIDYMRANDLIGDTNVTRLNEIIEKNINWYYLIGQKVFKYLAEYDYFKEHQVENTSAMPKPGQDDKKYESTKTTPPIKSNNKDNYVDYKNDGPTSAFTSIIMLIFLLTLQFIIRS